MRVIIVGGAGRYGRATTYFLANDPLVSDLVIADKDVNVAQAFAERLGGGVQTAEVDLRDEQSLDALLAGADIFVNTTGPYFETQVPALRAAIRCGVNYCDFSEDFQATEQALALDPKAKAANITAIVGIGLAPGITNLMAVHAVNQIDVTEKLQVGWASDIELLAGPARMNLEDIRDRGRVSGVMRQFLNEASGKIPAYVDGQWVEIGPDTEPEEIELAEGISLTAYPVGSAEVLTLPRYLSDVKSVWTMVGLLPVQANELVREQCRRMAAGEIDVHAAAIAVFEALENESDRWLDRPPGMIPGAVFAVARGLKDGRPVRYACAPGWSYSLKDEEFYYDPETGGSAALAALKMLSGEVEAHGVLPPEACFEPTTFFQELARRWGARPVDDNILIEKLTWLEDR